MTQQIVTVTVDRPLGSVHPNHPDMRYPINYGYIKGLLGGDGEEQDVYVLGIDHPLETFTGKLIAVIHRADDVEEKWVACPEDQTFTKEQIEQAVFFTEQYFSSTVQMLADETEHKEEKIADCLVCERLRQIHNGTNPYFVRELKTGYVVLGDFQRFPGYTLFLCKEHACELHFLEKEFRKQFLEEMALVAEAVYRAFQPQKLNYELLGVGNAVHMHWHFFPRRAGDTPSPGPVWKLPKEELYAEKYIPNDGQLTRLKLALNTELDQLLTQDNC